MCDQMFQLVAHLRLRICAVRAHGWTPSAAYGCHSSLLPGLGINMALQIRVYFQHNIVGLGVNSSVTDHTHTGPMDGLHQQHGCGGRAPDAGQRQRPGCSGEAVPRRCRCCVAGALLVRPLTDSVLGVRGGLDKGGGELCRSRCRCADLCLRTSTLFGC